MKFKRSLFAKRVVTPWYDTGICCGIWICFGIAVVLFGGAGIQIATATEAFQAFVWVPSLLTALGLVIIIYVLVRHIRQRHTH